MRALVQRVSSASVVDRGAGELVGEIGEGLVALVGITHDDDPTRAAKLADKLWNLRVFGDEDGAMNLSLADRSASGDDVGILVVSQFTLYGDARKGRRPSFVAAAPPGQAEPLVEHVVAELRSLGATVATGRFRTDMEVSLTNDGPVTISLEF